KPCLATGTPPCAIAHMPTLTDTSPTRTQFTAPRPRTQSSQPMISVSPTPPPRITSVTVQITDNDLSTLIALAPRCNLHDLTQALGPGPGIQTLIGLLNSIRR